jgi:hypothetical protein
VPRVVYSVRRSMRWSVAATAARMMAVLEAWDVAQMKPTSGKAARERGLPRYFTGKPCKLGHVAERFSSNGECVVCATLRAARWRKTAKGNAYQRQYNQTPKMREYHRVYDRNRYLERKGTVARDAPGGAPD